jgi:DNA-binding HxlR family transcriptional regulator
MRDESQYATEVSTWEECTLKCYTTFLDTFERASTMKTTVTRCPAERTLQLVAGRWKIIILHRLLDETLRFAELQRAINALTSSGITPKMLTQELRQMEDDGLVFRQIYAQVPPKVEYSLTPLGASLRPVVEAMEAWGHAHEQEVKAS